MPAGEEFISLKEAEKYCTYSQDYLNVLIRRGKLRAVKNGRNWTTKKEWLDEYLSDVREKEIGHGAQEPVKAERRVDLRELFKGVVAALCFSGVFLVFGFIFLASVSGPNSLDIGQSRPADGREAGANPMESNLFSIFSAAKDKLVAGLFNLIGVDYTAKTKVAEINQTASQSNARANIRILKDDKTEKSLSVSVLRKVQMDIDSLVGKIRLLKEELAKKSKQAAIKSQPETIIKVVETGEPKQEFLSAAKTEKEKSYIDQKARKDIDKILTFLGNLNPDRTVSSSSSDRGGFSIVSALTATFADLSSNALSVGNNHDHDKVTINGEGDITAAGDLTVSGSLTVVGSQTYSGAAEFTATSTVPVLSAIQNGTGLAFLADNLTVKGSTLSTNDTDTDLLIDPEGAGKVKFHSGSNYLDSLGNLVMAGDLTVDGSRITLGSSTIDNETSNLLKLTSPGNARMILGDSAGSNEFQITDSAGTNVATIDSDGNAAFNTLNVSGSFETSGAISGTTGLFLTSLTAPLILGGTGTASDLTLQTTSGVGEAGADMHFLVGNNGGTEAMTILNDGKVGVGTTDPQANLQVIGQVKITNSESVTTSYPDFLYVSNNADNVLMANDHAAAIRAQMYVSPTAANKSLRGIVGFVTVPETSTLSIGSIRGMDFTAHNFGQGTVGDQRGVYSYVTGRGSGNTTTMTGGYFQTGAVNTLTGTITNLRGIYIENTKPVGTLGTIANSYGLYIKNVNQGSTSNYAIYSEGGQSYFAGNIGVGVLSPTGVLHLKAGTAAASTAPLKFTSGISLTTPEAGAMEFDGTNLYFTPSDTRKTVAFLENPSFTAPTLGTAAATQLTVPTIIGGTATTADLTLQTTSGAGETGADMHFKVGNNGATEAMTILNDGKVGVGKGVPNYKLEVADGDVMFGGSGTRNFYVSRNDGTNFNISSAASGTGSTLGTITDSPLAIKTNGITRLYVSNSGYSGNVGIGTTAPDSKLTVRLDQDDSTEIAVINDNSGTSARSAIRLYNDISTIGGTSNTAGMLFGSSNYNLSGINPNSIRFFNSISTGDMDFYVGGSTRMYLSNSGNVGIGTTAPGAKLDIAGGAVDTDFRISRAGNPEMHLSIAAPGGNFPVAIMKNGSGSGLPALGLQGNGGVGVGTYSTLSLSAYPANGLIISGNVGIGTTGPYANLDLGNGIGDKLVLFHGATGLSDSYGLGIAAGRMYIRSSGATEAISILSSGNVGIGTTAPAVALDVVGSIKTSVNFRAGNLGIDGTYGTWFGSISNSKYSFGTATASGAYPLTLVSGNATFNDGYINFLTAGSERARIDSSGNVGIGTTAPSNRLTVYGPVGGSLTDIPFKFVRQTTGTTGLQSSMLGVALSTGDMLDGFGPMLRFMIEDNAGVENDIGKIGFFRDGADNEGGIAFKAGTDGDEQLVTIKSSGNVGIGTTAPGELFDVLGSVSGNAISLIRNSHSTNGYGLAVSGGDAASGNYALQVRDYNNTALMTVKGTGNVGIGTTGPAYPLDVNGNARFAGGTVYATSVSVTGVYGQRLYATVDGDTSIPAFVWNSDTNMGIYRPAADTLGFVTNGAERIRIDSSGNVGIGTTAPQNKLSIVDTVDGNFSGIAVENLMGGVGSLNETASITAILSGDGSTRRAGGSIIFGKEADYVLAGDRDSYASFNLAQDGTPTEKLRITSSGNVGIGTTGPANPLHVYHATTNEVARFQSGDPNVHVRLQDDSNSGFVSVFGSSNWMEMSGGTTAGSGIGVNLSSGNVGIGTTAPAYKLDIAGTLNANATSTFTGYVGVGTTAPTSKFTIRSDSSGSLVDLLRMENLGTAAVSSGTGLQFIMNRTTGGATEFGRIDQLTTSIDNTYYSGAMRFKIAANGTLDTIAEFGNPNIVLNRPLEVNVAGDTGISYDLQFMSAGTSHITSNGPLVISSGDINHAENLTLTTQSNEQAGDFGTATAGAATTLTDSTKAWTADEWIGGTVIIIDGSGKGQTQTITDNDATSITVADWDSTLGDPAANSVYRLAYVPGGDVLVDVVNSNSIFGGFKVLGNDNGGYAFRVAPDGDVFIGAEGAGGSDLFVKQNVTIYGGVLTAKQLQISEAGTPAATTATSGGSCADSTTYYYKVTAINDNGETTGTAQFSVTTGASGTNVNLNTIAWTTVMGATGYKVYRSTENNDWDGDTQDYWIDGKVFAAPTVTITDNCSGDTQSQTPPTTNTTGGKLAINTTSPTRRLEVLENTSAIPQMKLISDGSNYAEAYVDATGDLSLKLTGSGGDDMILLDENLKICSGGDFGSVSCPTWTIAGTGNLIVEGDVHAAGGYKNTFSFMYNDVADSQTDKVMDVLGMLGNTEFTLPYGGSVIGVSVASNADLAGGTVTVDPTVNGTKTGLTTLLDDTHQYNSGTQNVNTDTFSAGDRLGVKVTTDGSVDPNTIDIIVTIVVEY